MTVRNDWVLTKEKVATTHVFEYDGGMVVTRGVLYIPESFGWPEMAGCHFGGWFDVRDGRVVSYRAMAYMGPLTPDGQIAGYATKAQDEGASA